MPRQSFQTAVQIGLACLEIASSVPSADAAADPSVSAAAAVDEAAAAAAAAGS